MSGKLVLARRLGESLLLDHHTGPVVIDIVHISKSAVRVAIRAAKEVKVSRINNKGEMKEGA